MRELFEERRALNEVSNVSENMRYLLGYLEDAVCACTGDQLAREMLTTVYGKVVEARKAFLEAESTIDKYFSDYLTRETQESEVF